MSIIPFIEILVFQSVKLWFQNQRTLNIVFTKFEIVDVCCNKASYFILKFSFEPSFSLKKLETKNYLMYIAFRLW